MSLNKIINNEIRHIDIFNIFFNAACHHFSIIKNNDDKKMDKNLWLFLITLHLTIFNILEVFDDKFF